MTAAGYGLGASIGWPAERRRAFLLRLGIVLTVAFPRTALASISTATPALERAEVRGLHRAFVSQHHEVSAFAAVPADDAGPGAAFLVDCDRAASGILRPVLVFGRVPMFYYVVHFPLIHLIAVGVCLRAVRAHLLDVPVTNVGPVTSHVSAWLGLLAACSLPGVGTRRDCAVSVVSVVLAVETASLGCMAQLSVGSAPNDTTLEILPTHVYSALMSVKISD